ncbi:hypothetical protein HMPREF9554_01220 [Treponema phagedenis F0421]|nr:hypothetical protein HMPREF9554_01220 [Treponema phagedenis F0421]
MPKLHSERARTPVVLRSSDGFPVLSKWEIKLESCITPMVNYSPLSKTQNRHGRRWFNRIEFENYHSVLGVFKLIGLVLTWTSKPNRCVGLFFIKLFMICIKYIKNGLNYKKRYICSELLRFVCCPVLSEFFVFRFFHLAFTITKRIIAIRIKTHA